MSASPNLSSGAMSSRPKHPIYRPIHVVLARLRVDRCGRHARVPKELLDLRRWHAGIAEQAARGVSQPVGGRARKDAGVLRLPGLDAGIMRAPKDAFQP